MTAEIESETLVLRSGMPNTNPQDLLPVLLDSWERNNTILTNLLRTLPEGALALRPMRGSPSIGGHFAHIHSVRLAFVAECTPEIARSVPDDWTEDFSRNSLGFKLTESAIAVDKAVQNRLETGRQMYLHYDHPILLLQHMIWHEGYHHGQIKLTLKLAGQPLANQDIGPLTWRVWMNKTK